MLAPTGTLAQMHYLLVTTDTRLSQVLSERGTELAVSFRTVADAADAIRSTTEVIPDGCLLDGGLPVSIVDEYLGWWKRSPFRHGRLLLVAPAAVDLQADESIELLPRDVEFLLRAVLRAPAYRLEVGQQRLSCGSIVVDLTRSEAALLACLGQASGGLAATEILAAAFRQASDARAPGSTAVVRTHLANIRRKGREAGLGEVVRTVGRRYEAGDLVVRP